MTPVCNTEEYCVSNPISAPGNMIQTSKRTACCGPDPRRTVCAKTRNQPQYVRYTGDFSAGRSCCVPAAISLATMARPHCAQAANYLIMQSLPSCPQQLRPTPPAPRSSSPTLAHLYLPAEPRNLELNPDAGPSALVTTLPSYSAPRPPRALSTPRRKGSAARAHRPRRTKPLPQPAVPIVSAALSTEQVRCRPLAPP